MFGVIYLAIGFAVFAYLTWRNLFDDYQEEKLVSYAWMAILSVLVGGRLGYVLTHWEDFGGNLSLWWQVGKAPGFEIYGGVALALVWTGWYVWKNNWRMWSFFEDVTPIYYLLVAFFLVGELVSNDYQLSRLIDLLMVIGGYLLSYYVKGNYRSMSWYKSGKKGFVFFFVNSVVSFAIFAVLLWRNAAWYWPTVWFVTGLIFAVGLAILGEVLEIDAFGRKTNGQKN